LIGPLVASAFALAAPAPNPSVVAKSFAAALTDPFGRGSLYWRAPEWTTFRPAAKGGATPFVQRRSVQYFGPPASSVVRNAYAALPDAYSAALPTALPTGFTLSVSGWAPRSARTGPEASNPRYSSLFAAVYRRGRERVDVTQRLAGTKGWLGDPFGFECGAETTSTVDVNGAKATFGQGVEIIPHLYWRSGGVLYTVSGPFPAATLAAIARSLKPVGG
jgi:hypothetical protein